MNDSTSKWKILNGYMEIAKEVKKARLKAKISQHYLAKELGYKNGQFISNVESGKCTFPSSKIPRLAFLTSHPKESFKQALIRDFHHRIEVECGDKEPLSGMKIEDNYPRPKPFGELI